MPEALESLFKNLQLTDQTIPEEVLERVLFYVGLKSLRDLLICAQTCQQWHGAASAPVIFNWLFRSQHLKIISHVDQSSSGCHVIGRSNSSIVTISRSTTLISGLSMQSLFLSSRIVHFDGIYSCQQKYLREGLPECELYPPLYLVTYYRYIRFYLQNDQFRVICVISSEELENITEVFENSKCKQLKKCSVFRGHAKRLSSQMLRLLISDQKSHHQFEMIVDISPGGLLMTCQRYADLTSEANFSIDTWSPFKFRRLL